MALQPLVGLLPERRFGACAGHSIGVGSGRKILKLRLRGIMEHGKAKKATLRSQRADAKVGIHDAIGFSNQILVFLAIEFDCTNRFWLDRIQV
jgi:hypothetical protein